MPPQAGINLKEELREAELISFSNATSLNPSNDIPDLNYLFQSSASSLAVLINASTSDENSSLETRMSNESYELEDFDEEFIFDRLYVRVTFIVLYTIVFCFCFFGNLMVILVVTLHWRMRNITKFCLANLAFADLCVGVFCVYQNLSIYLIKSWVLGEFLCKMYQFINALSHTASVLILVVICVERYLVILYPFRCKRLLTINRLRILIICVWLASAIYCSPRLYYIVALQVLGMDGGIEIICTAKRTLYDSKTFDMIHFFLLFLLPLLVISILYTRMGITLWRTSQNQFPWTATATNLSHSSNETINEEFSAKIRAPSVRLSTLRKRERDQCIHKEDNGGAEELSHGSSTLRSNWIPPDGPRENSQHSSNIYKSASYAVTVENKCYVVGHGSNQMEISDRMKSQSKQSLSLASLALEVHRNKNLPSSPISDLTVANSNNCMCEGQVCTCNKNDHSHSLGRQNVPLRYRRETFMSSRRKRRFKKVQMTNLRGGKDALKSRQTVVKMLIVVVVTFAVCNFPFHLRKMFQYWWPNYNYVSIFSTLATPLTHLIMYANCAINPIIYAFMSKAFRSSFQDLLCCRWKKSFDLRTQRGSPHAVSVKSVRT